MTKEHMAFLSELRQSGWRVDLLSQRATLPTEVTARYPWIPTGYRDLVEEAALIASPDDKSWFLTQPDFAGTSGSAYAWNEWEIQSLDAAGSDDAWKAQIVQFWDSHLPILVSTKSGYAYFAIEKDEGRIVYGEEPEYEETVEIAPSLEAFMQLVAGKDARLSRYL
jgi:hypothetical protein